MELARNYGVVLPLVIESLSIAYRPAVLNMVKKSKQILDNKMLVAQCPHMMNQSALRKQLPAVSLYVVHMLFESKVGTLADQLNVIYFSNISIISDSYLSNKFGIMSGTLFSLMDSGAVLSRYNDGT